MFSVPSITFGWWLEELLKSTGLEGREMTDFLVLLWHSSDAHLITIA